MLLAKYASSKFGGLRAPLSPIYRLACHAARRGVWVRVGVAVIRGLVDVLVARQYTSSGSAKSRDKEGSGGSGPSKNARDRKTCHGVIRVLLNVGDVVHRRVVVVAALGLRCHIGSVGLRAMVRALTRRKKGYRGRVRFSAMNARVFVMGAVLFRGKYSGSSPGSKWPRLGEVKWKLKRSTNEMHSKI